MPHGILVLNWNERSGLEIIGEFPENINAKVTNKTLLQVFNMHSFSKEKGFAGLTTDEVNFGSLFLGEDINCYILIILTILENPDDFEIPLEEIAPLILEHLNDGDLEDYLPNIFESLKTRKQLT